MPAPIGEVTVITPDPTPKVQSTVATGADGVAGCASITIFAVVPEIQLLASVTVYVYVPADKPVIVVLVPVPVLVTAPGLRVKVHVPTAGNPLKTTLPVANAHVGCVIAPTVGVLGIACTSKVYVATSAVQGAPNGLFVVMVITTVFPISAATGV